MIPPLEILEVMIWEKEQKLQRVLRASKSRRIRPVSIAGRISPAMTEYNRREQARIEKLQGEVERLREALAELTADITGSAVLMDNISIARFEKAIAALEHKT